MEKYNYLIVGSGLFGSVFAHEMTKRGNRCLVIDKRAHVGGNVYCDNVNGINVHKYGAHIFHTNDKFIWDYVNSFVEFNNYVNSPLAYFKERLYNLPFNMNTFYQLWGVTTPDEARKKIQSQIEGLDLENPRNLEEQALKLVGPDIYETLIKGYTEKQWGRPAVDLPSFIIKRLPVRFTFDNNYFNDRYQGIPIGGYNRLISKLLENIELRLNVDYLQSKNELDKLADKVLYTGCIDEFYNYEFGELEYRSLNFDHEVLNMENYQGCAVVNYTEKQVPYTRIIEHKHFEFGNQPTTVITKEYPAQYSRGKEAYYPINDTANSNRYKKYYDKSQLENKVIFGGRLAEYKYYDMHQIIASAFKLIKNVENK